MLYDYILQIDLMAFLCVVNANEIIGKRCKSLHEKAE
jgi:hypothetical protein